MKDVARFVAAVAVGLAVGFLLALILPSRSSARRS